MRRALGILGPLVGLGLVGAWVEGSAWLAPLRESLRADAVPESALEVGPLGKLLRGNGLLRSERAEVDDRWPRESRNVLRAETEPHEARLDSVAPAAELASRGLPLISIAVSEEDLHDPGRGILFNWRERWERPAHVSYFEGGEHLFETDCGLRLHGGSSRAPVMKDGRDRGWHSYRVYLREGYGAAAFPSGMIFGPETEPLSRLIVRGRSPYSCAMAFDVARRVGLDAPAMRPALFLLNGELQGFFSLAEHVSRRQWSVRLGHEELDFYRIRGTNEDSDQRAYAALHRWVARMEPGKITWKRLSRKIDMGQLSRNLFVVGWTGVHDWVQGAAYLDRSRELPRWRWVHWDMDNSFELHPDLAREGFEQVPFVELLLHRPTSLRGRIFAGLLRDDPHFRKRFAALSMEMMNHRLTPAFLDARRRHYARIFGSKTHPGREVRRSSSFLRHRNRQVEADLAEHFGFAEAVTCRVRAHGEQGLVVDGYPVADSYAGRYFPGQMLRVRAAGGDAERSFVVNGELVRARELELRVEGRTRVVLLDEARERAGIGPTDG